MEKKLNVLFLIVLVISSSYFFSLYIHYQKEFFLSSNDLLTQKASVIDKNFKIATDKKYYQWQFLDDTPGKRIHLLKTNDPDYTYIPLDSGEYFSRNNSKEAIIGKKIKTVKIEGIKYVNINNSHYKVQGFLKDGSVNDLIILNNQKLEDNTLIKVLDGPILENVPSKYKIEEKTGFQDIFDIYTISKIIFYIINLTNIIMVVAISYLLNVSENRVIKIKFLLGHALKRLKYKYFLKLITILGILEIGCSISLIWFDYEILIVYILTLSTYIISNIYLWYRTFYKKEFLDNEFI